MVWKSLKFRKGLNVWSHDEFMLKRISWWRCKGVDNFDGIWLNKLWIRNIESARVSDLPCESCCSGRLWRTEVNFILLCPRSPGKVSRNCSKRNFICCTRLSHTNASVT